MNQKITVFMPVYNTEKYLRESIDSILKQTYKNFEFIIIDDGSTDSCGDIIKSYKDKRIVFFRNEENRGLSYTRNKGICLATGKFIAFMDSDDICKIDRLAVQVKFLEENPEYQIVASNADKLINEKLYVNKNINKKVVNGNIKLMFCCGILNGSVMMRRDFIIKNQIKYKEECFVAEDYQFFIDCTEKGGKIAILPQSLVIYRIGHNSITRKTVQFKSDDRKKLIDKIRIKSLENNGIILNKEEYLLFNTIFSDPMLDITLKDIENYKKLIKKIVPMKKIGIKEFTYEIKLTIVNRILDLNYSKLEKLKIVNFKMKGESFISYIKSIIKIILLG